MPNRFAISVLATAVALATIGQTSAATKKKIVKPAQSEESAEKDAVDDAVLGVAVDMLGGAMKKAKLPKGGKLILKQGLKTVKASAKKDGKTDAGKMKDPLKLLLGGDDE